MLTLGDLDGDVVVVLLEEDLQLGLDVLLRELEESVVLPGEGEETSPLRHEGSDRLDGGSVGHEAVLHVENGQDVLVHGGHRGVAQAHAARDHVCGALWEEEKMFTSSTVEVMI